MTKSANVSSRLPGVLSKKLPAALLLATSFCLTGAPAFAETDQQVRYGTPVDLPITLSGSYLAGRLAGQAHDFASAAAFYQETLGADPSNPVLMERTFMLKLANGDIIEAAKYAQDLSDAGSSNFLATMVTAADLVLAGEYPSASALLEHAGAGPLAELTTGIARSWALYGEGEIDAALKLVDELQGPDWFDVFKATHSALLTFSAGRNAEALGHIEDAYEADRGAIRVVDAFARIRAASGQQGKALEILDEYDKLVPGHPLLERTRQWVESGTPIPPLVSEPAVGISEIMYGLGAAIGRDGAEELSSAYLHLALHLDPGAEFAAVSLGNLFEKTENPARAIAALKRVAKDSPLKRDAEIQIGLNYNALDKLDEARSHLAALIEADPSDLEAVISLGNVLRAHKLFAESEEVYTRGIETLDTPQPQHWLIYYYRGICRERQKSWDAAEVDFRKALELYPDQPLVLNYLGYSLVDLGLNLDEALGMIRKAVALRPNDGFIVDSLGWAYYKLGRYEEAVKELERAVELRPADPVINDHLGDAYWKVGRRNEARFQWNHARDLDPEEDELPKILEKIANGMPEDNGVNAAEASSDKNGG